MNVEDLFDKLEMSDFKQLLMLINGSVETILSMNNMSKFTGTGTTCKSVSQPLVLLCIHE